MRRFIVTAVALVALACTPVASADYHALSSVYWKYCGHATWAYHGQNHYTSCPFALNVAAGVRASSDFGQSRLVGTSYSPVTRRSYKVSCVKRGHYAYRCYAGINAMIWIVLDY